MLSKLFKIIQYNLCGTNNSEYVLLGCAGNAILRFLPVVQFVMKNTDNTSLKPHHPPQIAQWLLRHIVAEQIRQPIVGDFEEAYSEIYKEDGAWRAACWYWWQIIRSLPAFIHHQIYWRIQMFRNYLKIALRNLAKHKGYSFINIAGLAIGIVCCLLVILYVRSELSYDRYHEKNDRVYRLITGMRSASYNGIAKIAGAWGPTAVAEFPEVEAAARFVFTGQTLVTRGENRFYETGGLYADSTVFDVFSYRILQGDPENALMAPNTMIITETLANKYFPEGDPVGKILRLDNHIDYRVTAVIEDVPLNSHFTFTYLLSMASYSHELKDDWTKWLQYYTYLLLEEGASPEAVEDGLPGMLAAHIGEAAKDFTPALQPLTSIHLHSKLHREIGANSDIAYIYIFSAIAFFILLIACTNFMNLATARAANRAKEVGVRKASGAHRSSLVKQFLGEALFFSFFALILAVMLTILILPAFNNVSGKAFTFSDLMQPDLAIAFVLLTAFVGLISGSYPAFLLSSFRPVEVLKGNLRISGNQLLRKGLVVFQYTISAALIMATGIMYNQLDFIRNKNLGFNKEQVVILPIQNNTMKEKSESVKQALLQHPNVESVSISSNVPGGGDWGIPVLPEGYTEENRPPFRMLVIDEDFIETYQIEMVAGRNFSKEISGDATHAWLMNEAAAKMLNWENPLEKTLAMPVLKRESAPVIGVVKDFHFRSFKENIAPLIFFIPPPSWYSLYSVRIHPENTRETLDFLKETWTTFSPDHPFTYRFFDQRFDLLHLVDVQAGQTMGYFTLLAIVIACLGLFGLASFTTQQRTKEIGIRKVLGSSASQIVILISKEFAKLVVLSLGIAAPIAYFAMTQWLQNFAYRTDIRPEIFLLAGGLTLLLALATVSFQTIRAAMTKPANALRYE